jgi:hypothetical protein
MSQVTYSSIARHPAQRPPHRALPASRTPVAGPPAQGVLVHLVADGSTADLPALARAVQDLVRSVAPGVVTRVSAFPPATPPRPAGPVPLGAPRQAPAPGPGPHLDLERRVLLVDAEPAPLTRREFDLLAHLYRHQGIALSRRQLMASVWDSPVGAGERTVDVHVRRLRIKLGRYADRLVTVRGFGYRFD